MIIHIGSLDSELRDELIYGTFYEVDTRKKSFESYTVN